MAGKGVVASRSHVVGKRAFSPMSLAQRTMSAVADGVFAHPMADLLRVGRTPWNRSSMTSAVSPGSTAGDAAVSGAGASSVIFSFTVIHTLTHERRPGPTLEERSSPDPPVRRKFPNYRNYVIRSITELRGLPSIMFVTML